MDALKTSMVISGAGIAAQSQRMRIVSENIANASNTGSTPGSDPYQRKTISFLEVIDRKTGIETIGIDKYGVDKSAFQEVYDPGNAAANKNGMVKMPNVDILIEMADMREVIRTYEANMQAAKQARNLISMTIDMIGG